MLKIPQDIRENLISILKKENIKFIQAYDEKNELIINYDNPSSVSNVKKVNTNFDTFSDFTLLWLFLSHPERFNDFFAKKINHYFFNKSNKYFYCDKNIFQNLLLNKSVSNNEQNYILTSSNTERYISLSEINKINKNDFETKHELDDKQIKKIRKIINRTAEPINSFRKFSI